MREAYSWLGRQFACQPLRPGARCISGMAVGKARHKKNLLHHRTRQVPLHERSGGPVRQRRNQGGRASLTSLSKWPGTNSHLMIEGSVQLDTIDSLKQNHSSSDNSRRAWPSDNEQAASNVPVASHSCRTVGDSTTPTHVHAILRVLHHASVTKRHHA
jgi:hypothetical protein